ncbi:hypothetical protein AYI70_g8427 [Smittium culicis]|uniref:Uncharacterized protein n=1 Tax=Smittium culicis TaxID=133412 RepID=A0A1R1XFY1_9FUNG|nr:hypothetical protein AYI70_g8427 [Smittium culicis]
MYTKDFVEIRFNHTFLNFQKPPPRAKELMSGAIIYLGLTLPLLTRHLKLSTNNLKGFQQYWYPPRGSLYL